MPSIKYLRALGTAAGLAMAAALAGHATAQEQTEPQAEAPAPAPAQFEEEKLRSFAVAFLQVDQINREYLPQLQQAASEEEQQQIRQEASEKMLGAVEDAEGITIDEYNQIIEFAQADPDLAKELHGYIQETAE